MNQRSWKQPERQSGYPPRVEEILRKQSLNDLDGGKEKLVIRRVGAEVSVSNNGENEGRMKSNEGAGMQDSLGAGGPPQVYADSDD
jgi:hypothetical protein